MIIVMIKMNLLFCIVLIVIVFTITRDVRWFIGTILLLAISCIGSKIIKNRCDEAYPDNPILANIIWILAGSGLVIAMIATFVIGRI